MDGTSRTEAFDDENEQTGGNKFDRLSGVLEQLIRDQMKRVLGKLLILISLSPIGCVTQEVRNDSPQNTFVATVHGKSAREDMLSEEDIELRAKLNNQLSHYQYVGQSRPRMTANNLSLVASNSEANWLAHSNSEDTIWSRRFRGVKNIEIKQMKIIPGFK